MQQDFTPKVEKVTIDPSAVKQQYTQMNQKAEQQTQQHQQQSTPPQEIDYTKFEEEEKRLDKILPYYRKQKEVYELEIAITRIECQMGKTNPSQVPGIIGKMLEIEEMETKLNWANLKLQQNQFNENILKQKEELEKMKQAEQNKTSEPPAATTEETKSTEQLNGE